MHNNYRTKYILEKFDITRQTLYNWIHEGMLPEPAKDWRGWRLWTQEDLDNIQCILANKSIKQKTISQDRKMESFLDISNRRYLGSKQKLVNFIDGIISSQIKDFNTFFEPFGGTGVVSNYYYNQDRSVIINDILHSNYISYDAFLGNSPYDDEKLKSYLEDFNNIKVNTDNYVSINFGNRYFSLDNARTIGYIRDEIDNLYHANAINLREKHILLTSLLYAADKVANTCGHYDAYREHLDSVKKIVFLMPKIISKVNNNNLIFNCDANKLVRKISADVTYIDTPYNSRQYGDAYHLLENIAENKKTELKGKAMKMINRDHLKSNYCTVKAVESFRDLIENLNTKHILVSYNNMSKKGNGRSNAKISNEEIIDILSKKGSVIVYETDFNAFTTGLSNISDHKELVYYCKVK